MTKLEAFEEALKQASVGDQVILYSEDGRIEYILELKVKEESK